MSRTGRRLTPTQRRLRLRPALCGGLMLMLLVGCRSRSDLVESELRSREAENRVLRAELNRIQTFNAAIDRQIVVPGPSVPFAPFTPPAIAGPASSITAPVPAPGPAAADPPISAMGNTVQKIEFGRGSGGLDEGYPPMNVGLMLYVIPRDSENSAIKAPGDLLILASEVTPQGVKVPLARWDIPALQLQKMWKSGLFSTAYVVSLKWERPPREEKIRIVARFTTLPDQRVFEADRDIQLANPSGLPRVTPVPMGPMPMLPGPPAETLPAPREGPILKSSAAGWGVDPRRESAKPAPREGARLREPEFDF